MSTIVHLGGGRGWLYEAAAKSISRIDKTLGHLLQITEAGRSFFQQDEHYQKYLRYQRGGPWAPIALSPNAPSIHQKGAAIDSDEAQKHLALMAEHGWIRTVYRNGKLVEPWHFEYDATRDQHLHETVTLARGADGTWHLPTETASVPEEDDDMLMLDIKVGNRQHKAALGVGTFRHFIPNDPYEHIKNLARVDDKWQPIDVTQLPAALRTWACDLHIWDIRGGEFVVLDPLDGSVKPGNVWSAVNAARSSIKTLERVTSTVTADYLKQLAKF